MSLSFCSFSSGSSGNCYLVRSDETAILIDAGISCKRIIEGLEKTGTSKDQVSGILLTHEHSDHVKGLRVLTKRLGNVKALANRQTWDNVDRSEFSDRCETFVTGETFQLGNIQVKPFRIFHDAAEPVGFSFLCGGRKLSLLTDTGCVDDSIIGEICDADTLVLEANHEEQLLMYGSYPYYLKRRILSDVGHLSNKAAAETLCRLLYGYQKSRRVLFAHLSKENNFPECVYQTVKNTLFEREHYLDEESLKMDILMRDCISTIYSV